MLFKFFRVLLFFLFSHSILLAAEPVAEFDSPSEKRLIIKAIDKGDVDAVIKLLKAGENPNDFGDTDFAAIHAAAASNNIKIVDVLLKNGVNIELRDKHVQKSTPLFYAVDWNNVEMIRFLIKNGANVNVKNGAGYFPLHYATKEDKVRILNLLIETGADVNAISDSKTSILASAISDENVEAVNILLKKGANPETLDFFGMTAISEAVLGENDESIDIVKALLAHGVKLSILDKYEKFSPLHHSARYGNVNVIKLLLAYGADPALMSGKGQLAEDIAKQEGHVEAERILKNARLSRKKN